MFIIEKRAIQFQETAKKSKIIIQQPKTSHIIKQFIRICIRGHP